MRAGFPPLPQADILFGPAVPVLLPPVAASTAQTRAFWPETLTHWKCAISWEGNNTEQSKVPQGERSARLLGKKTQVRDPGAAAPGDKQGSEGQRKGLRGVASTRALPGGSTSLMQTASTSPFSPRNFFVLFTRGVFSGPQLTD